MFSDTDWAVQAGRSGDDGAGDKLPRGLARQLYRRQPLGDQWSLRVAYYAPWLLHWWMSQPWLPTSTVVSGSGSFPNALDEKNRIMALSTGIFQKVRLPFLHHMSGS